MPLTEDEEFELLSLEREKNNVVTKGQQQSKYLGSEPIPEEKSTLSIQDRLVLSFADDIGKQEYLKKRYSLVERLPDGKFVVGDNVKNLQPIDPNGVFNDVVGDISDFAGEILPMAGQILVATAASTLAPATGGVSTILGGAAGAGAGESAKIVLGKLLGVRKGSFEDQLADAGMASVFGAGGEAFGQGLKLTAKGISKTTGKIFDALAKKQAVNNGLTVETTPMVNGIAKTLKMVANIPEESTRMVFKHGVEKTLGSEFNMNPRSVLTLVDDLSKSLDEQTMVLGKQIEKSTDKLLSKNISRVDVSDFYSNFRKELIDLNLLDDSGRVNKTALSSKNSTAGRKILSELIGENKLLAEYPETSKMQIDIKTLLKMQRSISDELDTMTPNMQKAVVNLLDGNVAQGGKSLGIRGSIKEIAKKTGSDDYVRSLDNYSTWLDLKNQVSAFKGKDKSSVEYLIKGLANQTETVKASLEKLNALSKNKFLDKIQMWSAAQDFTSANPNFMRLGMLAGAAGAAIPGRDNTLESKALRFGAGFAVGTPLGLRTILRSGAATNKLIKGAVKSSLPKLNPKAKKTLTALLSSVAKKDYEQKNSNRPSLKPIELK